MRDRGLERWGKVRAEGREASTSVPEKEKPTTNTIQNERKTKRPKGIGIPVHTKRLEKQQDEFSTSKRRRPLDLHFGVPAAAAAAARSSVCEVQEQRP
eukprot:1002360-Amphidinium_carterae.1